MSYKKLAYIAMTFLIFCNVAICRARSLQLSESKIDIGTHIVGVKVPVHLYLTNTGNREIVIKGVKTSCGCIIVKNEFSYIKSSESIKLEFEINSVGAEGSLEKKVWILTEEPESNIYTLVITGHFKSISNQLFAIPERVNLGITTNRDVIQRHLTLQRKGLIPLGNLQMKTSKPWITSEVEEMDDRMTRIRITICTPLEADFIQEEIIVSGKDPNDFLRVPIIGKFQPKIQPTPTIVYVTENEKIYPIHFTLQIPETLQLEKYEFSSDGLILSEFINDLKVQILPKILVRIEKDTKKKNFSMGKLLLFFEGEMQPVEIAFVSP